MKKKIVAVILVIVVFASLAAAEVFVLRARDLNPDFGLVAEKYTIKQGECYPKTPVICTGDTDKLNVFAVSNVGRNSRDGMTLWYECGDMDVAFTDCRYVDGSEILPYSEGGMGTVERREGSEWKDVGLLYDNNAYTQEGGRAPFWVGYEGRSGWTCVYVPTDEPGRYRITVNFRECLSTEYFDYATGEELYAVTFEYTVPCTDKPFDLAHFAIRGDAPKYYFRLGIRANCSERLWLDRAATTLEVREGGEWLDMTEQAGCGMDPDSPDRYFEGYGSDAELFVGAATVAVLDKEKEYRLRLTFVTAADGSGERYVLTIPFDFAKWTPPE